MYQYLVPIPSRVTLTGTDTLAMVSKKLYSVNNVGI